MISLKVKKIKSMQKYFNFKCNSAIKIIYISKLNPIDIFL